MLIIRLLILFSFFSLCFHGVYQAKPQRVCLKTDSGKIVVKRRCNASKGQLELDGAAVGALADPVGGAVGPVGPQGPAGAQGPKGEKGDPGFVDLVSCRPVFNQDTLISGYNDITNLVADCDADEFLLTHGGTTSDATTTIIATILRSFEGNGYPSGVEYFFARIEPQNTTTVTSVVTAVCCPI